MHKSLISLVAVVAIGVGLAFAANYTPTTKEAANTYSGATTFSGALTASGTVTLTGTSSALTNSAALTVTTGTHILSGIGGALGGSNTVTVVAPAAAGEEVVLIMAALTTNYITIADSGSVALAGPWSFSSTNDTLHLRAATAALWVEVSRSRN